MRHWFKAAFVVALLAAPAAWGQVRIDQLTAGAALSGTDAFANCQACGAATAAVKSTVSQILTYVLGQANTWAAAQTFPSSDLILKGSSTGVTTLNSGLSGAGNNTLTLPITSSDTLAGLGTAQTFTAVQSFTDGDLGLKGATSGTLTLKAAGTAGTDVITFPHATDTVAVLGTAQTWTANQTFSSANLAMGTNSITGNLTMSGVPILSGLSSGTQVSCLGLDSGNHVVLNAAACGSGGSSSGVGVQGGQSVSNIGDNATALPSGHYVYATNVAMTAARSHALPDSATQGVGDLEVCDAQFTVTTTNTLTVSAAGTDKLNNVTNGTAVIYTAGGCIGMHNDGAGKYTTTFYSTIPAPGASQVLTSNASSQAGWATTLPSGLTLPSATVTTAFTATGLVTYADIVNGTGNHLLRSNTGAAPSEFSEGTGVLTALGVNTNAAGGMCLEGTSGTACGLLNGTNTWSGTQTFGTVMGTITSQSGTTYTLAASDCGTTVRFTSASAVTVTIPATLNAGCNIAIEQAAAGAVSVNGSAVSPATLHSAHSYTKTSAQWAIIGIFLETNGVAILTGDGA